MAARRFAGFVVCPVDENSMFNKVQRNRHCTHPFLMAATCGNLPYTVDISGLSRVRHYHRQYLRHLLAHQNSQICKQMPEADLCK
jgi:hypothetical protein